jgi:hypothetical protein
MRGFSSLFLPPLFIIPLSGVGSLRGQHKKKHPKGMNKGMPKLTKEGLMVNMYLMKINFLILKLFIIKEFSAWMMKVFR